ncbi:MAG: transcriptional repressor [Nitrospirae bacterium]|nr:transcriptional repressor [Nitrospirota bacterium]
MENVIDEYREEGIKLTPQRIAIIDYLKGNKEHPSADDIYRAVKERFPTMSFATVYNTLGLLVARGKVVRISIDSVKMRFDPDNNPHHHLICSSCRRIDDICGDFGLGPPECLPEDYIVTGHHVEFYGICPDCNKTPGRSASRVPIKEGCHEKA